MSNDVIDRKVRNVLRLCDQNDDGVLEVADWESWVERLAGIRGWARATEEYAELDRFFVGAFKAFEADHGRDEGGVPIDGASDALQLLTEDEYEPFAQQFFGLIDADDDGVIGVQEYRDLMASVSIDRPTADRSFAKLDLDGDGRLSKAEFMRLYFEFFNSNDADAPGSWLWGPF